MSIGYRQDCREGIDKNVHTPIDKNVYHIIYKDNKEYNTEYNSSLYNRSLLPNAEEEERGEGVSASPSPLPHHAAITGRRELNEPREESFNGKEDKEEGSSSKTTELVEDQEELFDEETLVKSPKSDFRESVGVSHQTGTKKSILKQAEEVYGLYPLKVGKKAALPKIIQAIKEYGYEALREKVELYSEIMSKVPEPRFIPNPATWFHQGRYEDDPEVWKQRFQPIKQEIHRTIYTSRKSFKAPTEEDYAKGF